MLFAGKLLIVRLTGAEVVAPPALSVATALREYGPAGAFDQIMVKFVTAAELFVVCPSFVLPW